MSEARVAINLYTLREHLKNHEEIRRTLEKVKEIGYEAIQISGIGSIEPEKLKGIIEKLDLKVCASHISLDRLKNDFRNVVNEQKLYGCKHVAVPSLPKEYTKNYEGYKKAARELSEIGKKLADEGITLSYHNHYFEFEKFEGKVALDILFEESEEKYLKAEIDTYWVQFGGGDPAQWIRKLRGRVPLVHLKDMGIREGKQVFMEVGEGNLNWEEIIHACKEAGVEWYIVEQDESYRSPFESIRISKENLRKMGIT
ncbi:MAG: sugar phosphate isomerase/epimerase family protein [Thermoproteota archaeon]